ncbi:right-handed parallel beta-helix repeat-containing protein [Azospirillum sp. YIM B02556]|uniref:Right-handed parallel beta-helix repeat-containing protein n=1 Tax=Azospirillum endophyticum TaxID=2800326 RepID=A0ABS1FBK9_9PROT|nr:right-handed parallel beta-helix repeat-containing protein [Azospirillum endophyticum]MBK1840815.1 right-handed parallel beta-helix repeat-containing protein [Azospirillum endophyticum]
MTDTQQAFYVATNGNDSWSGRLAAPNADGTDGPFATLERAQGAMRATGIRDTYVRGGTYAMARTVTLTGADNGVRIMAFPGETPVFSGGERVGGFTAIGGGLYAAATSATGLDLSIGGVRQKVAQTGDWNAGDAKSGWSVLEAAAGGASKTSLRVGAGDGAMAAVLAAGIQPGTMVQTFDTERLSDNIVGVAAADAGSRTITFTQGVKYALRGGGTYRLLNDDAFIRDAGEFAWQAETGRLVVKPQDPGTLLAQGAVVARLGTLLALNGASGVTLQGLTFADTTWDGSALTLTNASGNSIAGNRFVNAGTAMTLTGSSGNVIEANRMEHLGAGGIKVTYGSNGNRISANILSDIGEVLKDVAGIQLYGTSGTLISGNDIRNSTRYGISIKNWDGATVNTDTVVEYNRLYNTMTETADGGAIEMLGRSNVDTRTIIRGNDIRDVGGLATDGSGWLDRQKSFGIYLDDMANGVTVQDNFIQNTGWASVFIHGGDSNTVTNNFATLTNPRERFIRLEWVPSAGTIGLLANNRVTGNAISSSTGVDYWEFWTPGSYSVTGNLLQGIRGLTGGDTVSSGLFANPAAGDFRLGAGAAAALGIHDLDWARMGYAPLTVPGIPNPGMGGGSGGGATSAVGTGGAPVAPSGPAFSPLAYIASYADLSAIFGANAAAGAAHYTASGRAEGRTVNFDPLAYIASYGDLANAFGTNGDAAAAHYITSGRAEGRAASFDPLAYLASYGDLAAAFGTDRTSAEIHYITSGRAEGRAASFDPLAYIASYGDLAAAFGTDRTAAEMHYLTSGRAEGRTVTFNPTAYLAANGDLAAAFGTDRTAAEMHYLTSGRAEGRTTGFNASAYLAANGDVAAATGGDLTAAMWHYIQHGRQEGRALSPVPARAAGLQPESAMLAAAGMG